MYLNICEKSDFLSVILLAKEIINIIKIGVPVILILMCTIDLSKQMLNPDSKSKPMSVLTKRMIAAVAIYFVPTLVTLLLDLLRTTNYSSTLCWTNAESSTIASLKAEEKIEREEQEKSLKKEQEESQKVYKELEESREKIREKNEELAEKAKEEAKEDPSATKKEDLTTVNDTTFLKENGTDGKVTVVDGVFYYPSSGLSGVEGTKGSGPYGYNIYFYNRMEAFVKAAKEAGYTIKYSDTEYGAWRPYENQEYYYNCYITKKCNNGNLAAKPGTSKHGWGIASDLKFGSQNAIYWAHDNASRFGLKFPLCNDVRDANNCRENWHLEPASLKKK